MPPKAAANEAPQRRQRGNNNNVSSDSDEDALNAQQPPQQAKANHKWSERFAHNVDGSDYCAMCLALISLFFLGVTAVLTVSPS